MLRRAFAPPEGAPVGRNLSDQVAAALGREIVAGVHKPGAALPSSQDVCDRFGVSRTALREAYSLLAAKSLIVARPKIGTRVRPRSQWNLFDPEVLAWHMQAAPAEGFVSDLFVLRQMIEPPAAALAAQTRSAATLQTLANAFERMRAFQDGAGDLIEADLSFHMAILGATANPFLTALGGLINASLQCVFRYSWVGADRMADDRLAQHRGILEAIHAGAAEVARARMAELLTDSRADVLSFLGGGRKARAGKN